MHCISEKRIVTVSTRFTFSTMEEGKKIKTPLTPIFIFKVLTCRNINRLKREGGLWHPWSPLVSAFCNWRALSFKTFSKRFSKYQDIFNFILYASISVVPNVWCILSRRREWGDSIISINNESLFSCIPYILGLNIFMIYIFYNKIRILRQSVGANGEEIRI